MAEVDWLADDFPNAHFVFVDDSGQLPPILLHRGIDAVIFPDAISYRLVTLELEQQVIKDSYKVKDLGFYF